jgi:hypothetical protein
MSSFGPLRARPIDRDNGTRTKPMRVLVLGLSKTGTFVGALSSGWDFAFMLTKFQALYTALQKLGYTPYHMTEACVSIYTGENLADKLAGV